MAVDKETNEAIQSTALAVVETQQKVVGSALVGGTGATLLAESTDSQSQILEQIREIQINTLRGIRGVKDKLVEMLTFEKDQARLEREQANEKLKEEPDTGAGEIDTGADEAKQDVEEGKGKLQAIGQFFAGLPGVGFITKLFKPILAFFGKGGMLVKLFGRFGPLGAFILAATLIYKYADDIAKALAPVVDKIKDLIVKLQPAIDVIMKIGDFLIKGIIKGIGEALNFVVGTVEKFIDGFKKLFEGDLIGAFNDIFEGILRVIFAVPLMIVNFLKPLFLDLVNMISEPWNNMVNAVHEYIGNIFTSISDFFSGMVDSVVGFFTTAWDNATAKITEDVTNMFNFVKDIFDSIVNAVSDAFFMVSDFVTNIPNRIMGFVKSMFEPIVDFFSSIGTSIKDAINGIIDTLPLPDFIKNKVKFNTEPTDAEIKTGSEEIINDNTPQAKGVVAQIAENKDKIQAYADARGLPFDLEQTLLMNRDKKPGDNATMMFGSNQYSDMIPLDKLQENTEAIKSGEMMTAKQQMEAEKPVPKIKMKDVGPVEGGTAPLTQIVNSSPVNAPTTIASSTTHAGKLDTGIDSYHDRRSYAYPVG
jgi:hypothetical protein